MNATARPIQPNMVVDGTTMGIALVLLTLGLIMVHSATVTKLPEATALNPWFLKQSIFASIGILVGALSWRHLPVEFWRKRSPALLLAGCALLLIIHIPGIGVSTQKGVTRWLNLGIATFQPVEAVKLFLMAYLCAYCAARGESIRELRRLAPPAIVVFVVAVLLMAQPDFGSTMIIGAIAGVVLFLAGARKTHMAVAVGAGGACAAALAVLSPYRLQRMMVFLDPLSDAQGMGYQQTHSLMAFNQGGWTGSGLGLSVQKWAQLPEAHNDFIIAVTAEELGFVGLAIVIACYMAITIRAFLIAREAELRGEMFASLAAKGIACMLALQVVLNVGSNLSLLPVKGLTLPLMSYGGSSLLVTCLMISILLRIDTENRRDTTAKAGG